MPTGDTRIRVPEALYNQIKVISGETGKSEGVVLQELLQEQVGDGQIDDLVNRLKVTPRRRTSRTREIVLPSTRTRREKAPLDRIADTMEKILGIKLMNKLVQDLEMSPSERAMLMGRNPNAFPQYSQPQQPPQPPKSLMDRITDIKLLESLGSAKEDPVMKEMLRDLKDAVKKQMEKPKALPGQDARKRLDDLREYMMMMKMFGSPDDQKQATQQFLNEVQSLRKELHTAEISAVKEAAKWTQENLQRQINEIRNAPTELQQITQMSKLAESDPAIKAYMHKKLGIKDKGEPLTPEKLKNYIESVEVPVGKILGGIYDYIKGRQGAPAQPPPPPSMQTQLPPTEQEIVARAAPELITEVPTEKSMSTFAEPAPLTAPQPPETVGLPPEEPETPPPPPKKQPPRKPKRQPKPKGDQKKK